MASEKPQDLVVTCTAPVNIAVIKYCECWSQVSPRLGSGRRAGGWTYRDWNQDPLVWRAESSWLGWEMIKAQGWRGRSPPPGSMGTVLETGVTAARIGGPGSWRPGPLAARINGQRGVDEDHCCRDLGSQGRREKAHGPDL